MLPFPSPGDLPDPVIEPRSPALQADSLLSELLGKSNNKYNIIYIYGMPFEKDNIFEENTAYFLLYNFYFVLRTTNRREC